MSKPKDRFERAAREVEAYDNLRSALAEAIPLHCDDDRIDILTRSIAELIDAMSTNHVPRADRG